MSGRTVRGGGIHTVGGILIQADTILLGRRSARRRSCPLCWDVIGGHVERDEEPVAALVRELDEEIDVDARDPAWLRNLPYRTGPGRPVMLHLFLVSDWARMPRLANDEDVELAWFPPAQAARLPALAMKDYRGVFAGLARS